MEGELRRLVQVEVQLLEIRVERVERRQDRRGRGIGGAGRGREEKDANEPGESGLFSFCFALLAATRASAPADVKNDVDNPKAVVHTFFRVSTDAASAPGPAEPVIRSPGFAQRMRWVAILYFAQGFPFGLFREVWGVFFRARGVALEEIGMMELLGLPWIIKPIWAPLVDRYGDRRHWIAGCLVVLAVTLGLHATFPIAAHPGLLRLERPASLHVRVRDPGHRDRRAHHRFPAARGGRCRERPAGLALPDRSHRGGRSAGVLWRDYTGWAPTFLIGGAILLALAPVVLRAPPAELVASERKKFLRPFVVWLTKPGSIPTLAFVLLYKLGDQAISPMIKPFWVDRGLSLKEIAMISTTLGIAFTVAGALLGGYLTTRWGLIRGLVVMGVFQLASNLAYALVALAEARKEAIFACGIFESFTQGLGTAAFLALLMRLCDKEHAGTQYALLSALFSLVRHLSGAASGWAAESFGYGPFFLYTVFLGLPAFALLPWVKRRVAAAVR